MPIQPEVNFPAIPKEISKELETFFIELRNMHRNVSDISNVSDNEIVEEGGGGAPSIRCYMYNDGADQPFAANNLRPVFFNATLYDNNEGALDEMFIDETPPADDHILIPSTGVYIINASIVIDSITDASACGFNIYKNSPIVDNILMTKIGTSSGFGGIMLNKSIIVELSATDTVFMFVNSQGLTPNIVHGLHQTWVLTQKLGEQ